MQNCIDLTWTAADTVAMLQGGGLALAVFAIGRIVLRLRCGYWV